MEGSNKWVAVAAAVALAGIGWWLSRPIQTGKKQSQGQQNQQQEQRKTTEQPIPQQKKADLNDWLRTMKQEQKVQQDDEKIKFLQVLQEIKKIFPAKMAIMRKEAQDERRLYYKKDPVKYRQVIVDFAMRQAVQMDNCLQELLQENGYDQALFETMVKKYMHDPLVAQAVQSLSQDAIYSNPQIPPTLNAEKFEELLKYQAERFEQLAKEECEGGEKAIAYSNTLILDEIEELHGFSEEQINAAMFYYTSPPNDQKYQSYLNRIRKATFKFMRSMTMM